MAETPSVEKFEHLAAHQVPAATCNTEWGSFLRHQEELACWHAFPVAPRRPWTVETGRL